MQDYELAAFTAVTFPLIPNARLYYTIRAETGFLAANHTDDGPPIQVTASPENATRFVDVTTAGRRAAALQQLGWRDLRIVAIQVPAIRL